MAKRRNSEATPSKLTVMLFQLEGDDETLQEGFKTVSAAMTRLLPAVQQAAFLPSPIVPSLPGPNESRSDDSVVLEADADPVTKPSKSGKRSVKSPQVLDMDLTSGNPPLNEYLSQYPGEETTKRYLLIASWLKAQKQIAEVSMDHIHTCFRHMGWQTPKQAAQPLRDMKSRLGWFHKGDERGHYKINHVGENEVMRIMEGKS